MLSKGQEHKTLFRLERKTNVIGVLPSPDIISCKHDSSELKSFEDGDGNLDHKENLYKDNPLLASEFKFQPVILKERNDRVKEDKGKENVEITKIGIGQGNANGKQKTTSTLKTFGVFDKIGETLPPALRTSLLSQISTKDHNSASEKSSSVKPSEPTSNILSTENNSSTSTAVLVPLKVKEYSESSSSIWNNQRGSLSANENEAREYPESKIPFPPQKNHKWKPSEESRRGYRDEKFQATAFHQTQKFPPAETVQQPPICTISKTAENASKEAKAHPFGSSPSSYAPSISRETENTSPEVNQSLMNSVLPTTPKVPFTTMNQQLQTTLPLTGISQPRRFHSPMHQEPRNLTQPLRYSQPPIVPHLFIRNQQQTELYAPTYSLPRSSMPHASIYSQPHFMPDPSRYPQPPLMPDPLRYRSASVMPLPRGLIIDPVRPYTPMCSQSLSMPYPLSRTNQEICVQSRIQHSKSTSLSSSGLPDHSISSTSQSATRNARKLQPPHLISKKSYSPQTSPDPSSSSYNQSQTSSNSNIHDQSPGCHRGSALSMLRALDQWLKLSVLSPPNQLLIFNQLLKSFGPATNEQSESLKSLINDMLLFYDQIQKKRASKNEEWYSVDTIVSDIAQLEKHFSDRISYVLSSWNTTLSETPRVQSCNMERNKSVASSPENDQACSHTRNICDDSFRNSKQKQHQSIWKFDSKYFKSTPLFFPNHFVNQLSRNDSELTIIDPSIWNDQQQKVDHLPGNNDLKAIELSDIQKNSSYRYPWNDDDDYQPVDISPRNNQQEQVNNYWNNQKNPSDYSPWNDFTPRNIQQVSSDRSPWSVPSPKNVQHVSKDHSLSNDDDHHLIEFDQQDSSCSSFRHDQQ